MIRNCFVVLVFAGLCGCGATAVPEPATPTIPDLQAVRREYKSQLTTRGPAPQPYQAETPPAGVTEVEYPSGDLKLKGWLSEDFGDGKKRPAVVFLHGGWSFGMGDWVDARPFEEAGFVVFTPMLRGENGNPGHYESFLGEVDDAIAAGEYVAALPFVDSEQIFVAGHSVGAVLTCLTAMMPSRYKAAASLDGSVELMMWMSGAPAKYIPYDRRIPQETRIRNPAAHAGSLRIPLKLYTTDQTRQLNEILANAAKSNGKECELVPMPGDHRTMVEPSVRKAIEWFQTMQIKQ